MPADTATFRPSLDSTHSGVSTAWRWVGGAVICLFLANVWRVEADADLWGHLRFGLESLSAGKLATTDPYSYTAAGASWTNHEWLAELTLAVSYRLAGVYGLILLRALLLVATFTGLGVLVWRRKLSPPATLALALFAITFLPEFYRLRPQMFTYTAFAWLLVLCDQHGAGRRLGLAILPLLVAVWCNFHAGFVAGLGIFGIYWCTFAWEARNLPNRWQEWQFLVAVMMASVLATFCNPYGIAYWRYVLFAITMPRPEITEWGAVWSHHPVVLGCYLAAVLVPAVTWLGSSRRGGVAETAAFVLVACLSARHARHLPFAMMLGCVVFARRWPEFQWRIADFCWSSFNSQQGTETRTRSASEDVDSIPRWRLGLVSNGWGSAAGNVTTIPAGFGLAMLVLLASLGGVTKLTREVAAAQHEGVLTVQTDLYPVAAVSFLTKQHIEGNLYCGFNWGEYCLWHLAPRSRVFCDGRYETVYPADISRLALGPLVNEADRRAILETYPTEILLVPTDGPLAAWLAARPDAAEVYHDDVARVFLKRIDKFAPWLWQAAAGAPPITSSETGRHVPFPG